MHFCLNAFYGFIELIYFFNYHVNNRVLLHQMYEEIVKMHVASLKNSIKRTKLHALKLMMNNYVVITRHK